jgi:NADP-dependent alcohol dehydrogenase
MRAFQYENPTKIFFGAGQIESMRAAVPKDARVLCVYGRGSARENGVHAQVTAALAEHSVREFWGVSPNPDLSDLLPLIELVRSEGIDFIVAVGGGSVIDASKFVAVAARASAPPWTLLSRGVQVTDAVPVGVVLTLSATGSETNSVMAISHREKRQKLIYSSPRSYPRFAVLDPELTYSLPERQVQNGIVDAFVHVLEQYLTFPVGAHLQDRLAESILSTIYEQGPVALREPKSYEARANLMWCATLALNGLIGLGVPQDWTTHHIGHELTALFGLEHARSLAVALPAVLQARRDAKAAKLLQLGERVFGVSAAAGTDNDRIDETLARLTSFLQAMGMSTRLGDYGVSAEAVDQVALNLKASRRLRMGERLDITPEQAKTFLLAAL